MNLSISVRFLQATPNLQDYTASSENIVDLKKKNYKQHRPSSRIVRPYKFRYFLRLLTTRSIPSCTPSPLVALQAWICHSRSWHFLQSWILCFQFWIQCRLAATFQMIWHCCTFPHLDLILSILTPFSAILILCRAVPSATWADEAEPRRSCRRDHYKIIITQNFMQIVKNRTSITKVQRPSAW